MTTANIPTSTLIFVDNATSGTQTGNAINIDATGYYYFESTPINAWVKLKTPAGTPAASVNIYNADGSLTGNREVKLAGHNLGFTGTGNVGIGTTAPAVKLDMVGTTFGIKNSATTGSWDNLWFNVGPSIPSINASGAESGLQFNVGSNAFGTYGDSNQVLATVATMLPNGNMGIGTTTPAARLDVAGTIKITDGTQAANRVLTSDANGLARWNSIPAASSLISSTPIGGDAITPPIPVDVNFSVPNAVTTNLINLPSFTLTTPSIVDISANISASFNVFGSATIGLEDGNNRNATVFFRFTGAPAGVSNSPFGSSTIIYSNTASPNGGIVHGFFYASPTAMVSLPAGTYTLQVSATSSASNNGCRITYGTGNVDSIYIKATPIQ